MWMFRIPLPPPPPPPDVFAKLEESIRRLHLRQLEEAIYRAVKRAITDAHTPSAVAMEREACAGLLDKHSHAGEKHCGLQGCCGAIFDDVADAIRARS